MNDAISRTALLRKTRPVQNLVVKRCGDEWQVEMVTLEDIIDAPALDVVPVVRCKDCKHRCTYKCPMYHTETCIDDLDGFDDYNVDRTDDDGFCHLGARNGR